MSAYIRYFGYFVYLFILWVYARRNPRQVTVKERIGEKTVTRYNWIFALIVVAPLIYLAATRGERMGDTAVYMQTLRDAPSSLGAIFDYLGGFRKEYLFYSFTAVFKSFFGYKPVAFFLVIALGQALLMTVTLRKYSCNLLVSFFLFFASSDFISYMNNGIRQFIAVCLIFSAARFIFEHKYIKAIAIALLASLFHETALLMIPFIIIVQGKPWNKSTTIVLLFALATLAFVGTFTDVLESMLSETSYSSIVENWQSWNDDGTNPIRVVVYCVPAIISLIGLKHIRETNDPIINVCTNMSVITAGLYIISMITSGIYMGRLPIYTSVFSNCILLPWEVEHIFNKRSSDFLIRMMIVCYILFYYYQIHYIWGAV